MQSFDFSYIISSGLFPSDPEVSHEDDIPIFVSVGIVPIVPIPHGWVHDRDVRPYEPFSDYVVKLVTHTLFTGKYHTI